MNILDGRTNCFPIQLLIGPEHGTRLVENFFMHSSRSVIFQLPKKGCDLNEVHHQRSCDLFLNQKPTACLLNIMEKTFSDESISSLI